MPLNLALSPNQFMGGAITYSMDDDSDMDESDEESDEEEQGLSLKSFKAS